MLDGAACSARAPPGDGLIATTSTAAARAPPTRDDHRPTGRSLHDRFTCSPPAYVVRLATSGRGIGGGLRAPSARRPPAVRTPVASSALRSNTAMTVNVPTGRPARIC